MKSVSTWINLAILGVLLFVAFKAIQWLKSPQGQGTVDWWKNTFGGLKPGTQIADTTGQAGANAAQKAFTSVVNRSSQGFYNAALQQFAYDNDFDTSLEAQGTTNWPWRTYADWKNAGEPHLPGEEAVYSDDSGMWHNDYV